MLLCLIIFRNVFDTMQSIQFRNSFVSDKQFKAKQYSPFPPEVNVFVTLKGRTSMFAGLEN